MSTFGKLAAAALVLAGLGAAGAAAAQDGPRHGRAIDLEFDAIDTDGDGTVTRDELAARATARLAEIDTNGDGVLAREEIVAIMPARPAALMHPFGRDPAEVRADRMLEWMDAVEAGQFEIAALVERQINGLLAAADRNRDGAITEDEADAMRERFAERGRGHHGRDDRRPRDRF